MSTEEIRVPGWPAPRGYANGRAGHGRPVHVAGQIGWDAHGQLVSAEFVPQFIQALDNVITVVRAAGGVPADIATMTAFVTDVAAYRAAARELGAAWRARLGRHFPAMTLVGVTGLVEPGAMIEIQATAYIVEAGGGAGGAR
ncbi:MAG TPA: RidA family protein [Kofleriaceae bacterium]|jgi:enamine deaminase RidA (YjgF/YER057c/UK114 family)|nr:RidA family protein [Kofleriaceae bacterium]